MADNGTARVTITEEAIKERVTEYLAQAWDEGYSTCLGDFDIAARREARSPNPYRSNAD